MLIQKSLSLLERQTKYFKDSGILNNYTCEIVRFVTSSKGRADDWLGESGVLQNEKFPMSKFFTNINTKPDWPIHLILLDG